VTETAPQLLRAPDVMQETGATYRQVDYWTRQGLVAHDRDLSDETQAEVDAGNLEPTSGHARVWDTTEVETIRRAVLVSRAFPHLTGDVVFRIARATGPLDLGDGIVVTTPWSAP
jgi:hypothetical protein